MNWYVAKLVYRIICGKGEHKAQFDEQLRLIEASSQEEAINKAGAIGQAEQMNFLNQHQQMVQWKFINISDLYRLSEVVDGAELYSRIEERDDGAIYEEIIHSRASHLKEVNTPHLQSI